MNKEVVILGTSMFSAELTYILQQSGINIKAFSVDEQFMNGHVYCNLPVYPFENIEKYIDMSSVFIAISFGYSQMNNLRRNKYKECKEKGYKLFTFLSPHSIILTNKVGEGSIIMPNTYLGPYSELGVCNVVRPGTVLSHHVIMGNCNWVADGCTFGGGVKMGDNCFIGLNSTIRNEISIADYTFIGAHSYLSQDSLKEMAYLGVPAKQVNDQSSFDTIKKV